MIGSRCEECGEVRWSLLGRAAEPGPCPVCGAQMVAERRHPGHGGARFAAERRDAPAPRTPTRLTRA